jgi:heavy metal sensor kinase
MSSFRLIPRSVRFRLTAWYACLLILMVLAIGLSLTTLLERELRQDVDHRLLSTAQDIKSQIVIRGDPDVAVQGFVPPPEAFSFPGLLIQIVNADDVPQVSSENLGQRTLPAVGITQGSTDPVFRTGTVDGVMVRTVHLPLVLRENGRTIGAVNVGEPLIQLDQTIAHLRQIMLIIVAVGVAVAVAGGWFLAGRALRPVDRITAAARDIALERGTMQSLATRLEVPATGDELARLAVTFNQMLDRLEQAFAAQRRFIADASHEMRTPLTAIRGNTDVLLRQATLDELPTRTDLIDALEDVRRETGRMGRLLQDLLTLARADAPVSEPSDRPQPVDVSDVAREAVHTAQAIANGQRIGLDAAGPVMVAANPDHLQQLLLILLENAVRHTPPDGTITVSIQRIGDQARIRIQDTGEGIASEHLPHIFERFYRADADSARTRNRGGTGLGLAIAQAIVRSYEGEITASSAVGVGTAFTVTLPLASALVAASAGTPVPSPTRGVH